MSAYNNRFQAPTKSIRDLDRQGAERKKDFRVQRLKTMSKVGRVASLTFLAAVDNVRRFLSSGKLAG